MAEIENKIHNQMLPKQLQMMSSCVYSDTRKLSVCLLSHHVQWNEMIISAKYILNSIELNCFQGGDDCYCGQNLGLKVSDGQCSIACKGNNTEMCGSHVHGSIYKAGNFC